MNLLNKMNISTKVFSGFAVVLVLLIAIATISLLSLVGADRNFKNYRALAPRPTRSAGFRPTC